MQIFQCGGGTPVSETFKANPPQGKALSVSVKLNYTQKLGTKYGLALKVLDAGGLLHFQGWKACI